jgi:hypothetical protein
MRGFALLWLVGCTTQDGFDAAFVEASCDRVAACAGDGGESLFGDRQGCVDFYTDGVASWSQGCAFDPKAARACLDAFETTDCGDSLSESCDPVYTGACTWGGK